MVDYSKLFSSLSEYNTQVNTTINSIHKALIVVGVVVISILWYAHFIDMQKRLLENQQSMSTDVLMQASYKYFVAYAMVMLSGQIIDALLWLGNAIAHLIDVNMTKSLTNTILFVAKESNGNIFENMFVNAIQGMAKIAQWIAQITIQILVFLRFVELYIYKAFAPILIAGFVSDDYKSVAQGYMKQFIAVILQGALLIFLIKLYDVLAVADMFTISTAKGDDALSQAVLFLVKSFVYIFVLVGSQNKVKKWMGV